MPTRAFPEMIKDFPTYRTDYELLPNQQKNAKRKAARKKAKSAQASTSTSTSDFKDSDELASPAAGTSHSEGT